jgi:hypothetical protein
MTKTVSKRDQMIALQAEMQEAEKTALVQLSEILNSESMQAAIAEMERLQSQVIPGGVGEAHLKACVDVPRNVISWLSTVAPSQQAPIPVTQVPAK